MDDELESLLRRARATLDDAEYGGLFERAAVAAMKAHGPEHPGGERTTMTAYHEALKAEVRRVLTGD